MDLSWELRSQETHKRRAQASVLVEKTYIPKLDAEKCNACAVCTRACPAETIPEQRKEVLSLRGRIY